MIVKRRIKQVLTSTLAPSEKNSFSSLLFQTTYRSFEQCIKLVLSKERVFFAQESHGDRSPDGDSSIKKISPKFQTLFFFDGQFFEQNFTDFGQNSD